MERLIVVLSVELPRVGSWSGGSGPTVVSPPVSIITICRHKLSDEAATPVMRDCPDDGHREGRVQGRRCRRLEATASLEAAVRIR